MRWLDKKMRRWSSGVRHIGCSPTPCIRGSQRIVLRYRQTCPPPTSRLTTTLLLPNTTTTTAVIWRYSVQYHSPSVLIFSVVSSVFLGSIQTVYHLVYTGCVTVVSACVCVYLWDSYGQCCYFIIFRRSTVSTDASEPKSDGVCVWVKCRLISETVSFKLFLSLSFFLFLSDIACAPETPPTIIIKRVFVLSYVRLTYVHAPRFVSNVIGLTST